MFRLEYAQYRNGEFSAWIEAGDFDTYAAALAEANSRGLMVEGEDYLISRVFEED